MNTAGAIELGYASSAIVGALLERLVVKGVLSPAETKIILDDAIISLQSLGHLVSVPGAIRIVSDVRAELAKHGVG
jgi:hypothetical protein